MSLSLSLSRTLFVVYQLYVYVVRELGQADVDEERIEDQVHREDWSEFEMTPRLAPEPDK